MVIMLVGNKTDLKTNREVATEEAKKFAQKNDLLYIETSALDGENIKEAFQQTITGKSLFSSFFFPIIISKSYGIIFLLKQPFTKRDLRL